MILGPDKSKLSKRHGATSVIEYRDTGYVPEAVVNFLALLGWALDDKTEIMSRDDLIKYFSLERISKTAAIFSQEKLYWMNGVYLRQIVEKQGFGEFVRRALPFLESGLPDTAKRPIDQEYVNRIAPLMYERMNLLSELAERSGFFFVEELDYDAESLVVKGMDKEKAIASLKMCWERLEDCPFDHNALEGVLRSLTEELGLKTGSLFGLIRVAVTGRTASPPLFETMAVLGKDRCLGRIGAAIARLRGSSGL
jgi:glutamyl-tRNA synthetase